MATTLAQYYQSLGQPLPSVSERRTLAQNAGIANYSGTAQQNNQLLQFLQSSQTPVSKAQIGTLASNAMAQAPVAPVITNNGVDLSQVQQVSSIVPTPQPQPVPQIPQTPFVSPTPVVSPIDTELNRLSTERQTVVQEIQAIEDRLAGRPGERNQALEQGGVFDDLRTLNQLKDRLRSLEDRQIEVPIEARQELTGRQATRTEFAQRITPELEANVLQTLATTRQTQALGDAITTNIAIIDERLNAQTAQDELIYSRKVKYLDSLESVYSNIITEQQKAQLEEKKFAMQLELEGIKFNNDLLKTGLQQAAQRGATAQDLQRLISSGSLADIYGFNAGYLTPEQVIRLEELQARNIQLNQEQQAEMQALQAQKNSINQELINNIDLVDRILGNEKGLKASVGVSPFGRSTLFSNWLGDTPGSFINPFGGVIEEALTGDAAAFRTDLQQLVSKETLQYFLSLKSQGATFGAMTEAEWAMLEKAALDLGIVGEGKSKLSEPQFKQRIEQLQTGIMKIFLRTNMGANTYAQAGYQNATKNELLPVFNALKNTAPTTNQNFFQNDFSDTSQIKDRTPVSTIIGTGVATGIQAGSSAWKNGFDFVLQGGKGAPVPAPIMGTVVFAGNNGGFGNQVKIKQPDGTEWWFSHLDNIYTRVGQQITPGSIFGTQGNTGNLLGSKGEKLTPQQIASGRGTHLDITVRRPDGTYLTSQQVASLLNTRPLA